MENLISETYTGFGLIVHILKPVINLWNTYKQNAIKSTEACGILVGYNDMDGTRIWVNSATAPMRKDIRKITYFFLKDDGHQNKLNSLFKKSGNKLHLLGTWHTHPEKNPTPSTCGNVNDIDEWRKIIVGNKSILSFCFAIIGTEENSIYIPYRNKFEKLNRIN